MKGERGVVCVGWFSRRDGGLKRDEGVVATPRLCQKVIEASNDGCG